MSSGMKVEPQNFKMNRLSRESPIHLKKRDGMVRRMFSDPLQRLQEKRKREKELKQMPDIVEFSSNHIMINKERLARGIEQLERCNVLDEVASNHAKLMAERIHLYENLSEGCKVFLKRHKNISSTYEINVECASSIRKSHLMLMCRESSRRNILNPNFNSMGVGFARDRKGWLYICQVFM